MEEERPLDPHLHAESYLGLRLEQSRPAEGLGSIVQGGRRRNVAFYTLFSFSDWLDWVVMLVGTVAAVLHGSSFPVFFIFLGKLINALGGNVLGSASASDEVAKYAIYFVYLSIVLLVTGWLEVSLWMYTGDRQSARIKNCYLMALMSQDINFFDTGISTTEVMVQLSADITSIQEAIGAKTGRFIHYISQFLAGYVIGFYYVWQLTLVTLSVMPMIVMAGGVYAYIMIGLASRGQAAYVRAAEIANEVVDQIRTVHAFVGEEKACKSYSDALLLTRKLGIRSALAKGLGVGTLYGLGFASFSLLLWYSGRLIQNGVTNGGQAFSTILNVIASSLALGQAAPDLAAFSKARVSGCTIIEMIRRKPSSGDSKGEGIKLSKLQGQIEVRDVYFSYPSRPDVNVFQKFSLSIPAGKAVAIVGSSGSGKSTIISLIERFYDPTSGDVLLDGHNIKSLQLKWLRDQMGLVSQEPALFATSIRENILYGKAEDVTMDEIVQAASISCAHDFINVLPNRYETLVGERGVQLSGGQKQRIAIARAMLKNPSILLLDEATSALDAESEKSVQSALDQVMVGRTTVVVAHRLSTIQSADMIAALQEGKVVEVGTHDELMRKGKVYASLVHIQEDGMKQAQEGPAMRHHSRLSHGSMSRRSMSFCSNAESIPSSAGQAVEMGLPSLKRLLIMNLTEWPYGLLAALGAIIAGAQTPLFALTIAQALEYFYVPDEVYMKRGLKKVSLLSLGLGVVVLLSYVCEFYYCGIVGEGLTMRVRRNMFSALLRNEIGWFDRNSSSLLSSRLSTDAALVRAVVAERITALFQNLGLIMTAFTIAFTIQWQVALVTVACSPAMIGANAGQILFMKGFGGNLNQANANANNVACEAVSNIRTVVAFCAEQKVIGLFSKELEELSKRAFKRGQVAGMGFGLSQFCLLSSYGLTLWYASTLIRKGEAEFGQVMKCFVVLMITAFGVAEALSLAPDIMKGTSTLRGVFEIMDRKTEIDPDDPQAKEVAEVKGSVELRHVELRYPARPEVVVLKDFNLKVHRGQSVALVGASGSGKSSVIGLIARFYDPLHGRVMIDGEDIRTLRLTSVRRRVGLVQQEPALFSTTIFDNICYGTENATHADVVAAAKVANAHAFITTLPAGYQTEVGVRGMRLSGGQKQRVAIARVVLRDPAVLLLDEATSALDAESEAAVQEALDQVMPGRTTVMVAHRLSTIHNAHSIAVLEGGTIAEQGSHDHLVAKRGLYHRLLQLSNN